MAGRCTDRVVLNRCRVPELASRFEVARVVRFGEVRVNLKSNDCSDRNNQAAEVMRYFNS